MATTKQRIDYCARCGRTDRLNPFGLCMACASHPRVIQIDTARRVRATDPRNQPRVPSPSS